ncbi:nucleoside phosphorylase domain-containing protein [Aspergillus avenaceus]|uniref:Nucleoside phosphorylase domain-containing protein n=1 Tax=Aspergillus avenaceus TaxID=36643 RepID=A0A5N6U8F1_ASPAV|nr:nucleoside phosphorylase domain-containing protein [Aspergillus avenaceus]
MLDEIWEEEEDQYDKAPGDINSYLFGRSGRHPVVLAYMPGMGKSSAAAVAAHVRNSFPNIRLALVLGVCGGVPHPRGHNVGISFGDVIVSTGVVELDFGRLYDEGVIRKDTLLDRLGPPNIEIRWFLRKLQEWRAFERLQLDFQSNITDIRDKGSHSWTFVPPEEPFPGVSEIQRCHDSTQDVYEETPASFHNQNYDIGCQHPSEKESHNSLSSFESQDHITDSQIPTIHFGLVGSCDQVIRSASYRDGIAAQEGVIGFEMEGAGVWDSLPTIVVKGVCDYADDQKNKRWQRHASITAAACAKAMLREWRSTRKHPVRKRQIETQKDSDIAPIMVRIPLHTLSHANKARATSHSTTGQR